jgi:galactose mutarotase-like enzyme
MTRVSEAEHCGLRAFVLESATSKAVLLPSHGFNLAGFSHLPSGREAFDPPHGGTYAEIPANAPFSKFHTSGCDDMLPTIDACAIDGAALPDHGEVWSREWNAAAEGEAVAGNVELRCLPLRLEKRVRLDGNELSMEYRLSNLSDKPRTYLWALHPLFRLEDDTLLRLPHGTGRIVNVHPSDFLGEPGDIHPWPLAAPVYDQEFDLSQAGKYPAGKDFKFYVKGGLFRGSAALEFPRDHLFLEVAFDPGKLPWLGVWISTGGFRNSRLIAIEPASAFCDSPADARSRNTEAVLGPRETREWTVALRWTQREKLVKNDYAW